MNWNCGEPHAGIQIECFVCGAISCSSVMLVVKISTPEPGREIHFSDCKSIYSSQVPVNLVHISNFLFFNFPAPERRNLHCLQKKHGATRLRKERVLLAFRVCITCSPMSKDVALVLGPW